MKPDDPKGLLARLLSHGRVVCDTVKTARKGRQSLRGDGMYARKFHEAVVVLSGITARLEPLVQNLDGASEAWKQIKGNCETLKNPDADATTRLAAMNAMALTAHTVLEPALDRTPGPTVPERADIRTTPRLKPDDIEAAKKMAELYVVIHCYENSARRVVAEVLTKKLGANWFDIAANSSMKNIYQQRHAKEAKNKWITPRGTSPLYYLEWGDLLSLIHKYEEDFKALIPDYKFVDLRFEEMERFRNVVAHNGTLPSPDDFDHVMVSFRQWCKQLA